MNFRPGSHTSFVLYCLGAKLPQNLLTYNSKTILWEIALIIYWTEED